MIFTCPHCGENRIEEVMTGVTVASVIISISDDGDHVYGEQTNEDGDVDRYQCMQCGYTPLRAQGGPITHCDELSAWVKENCPQEEK